MNINYRQKLILGFYIYCSHFLLVYAQANTTNVCETKKKFFDQYQCVAFTGEEWNQAAAQEACEEGTVTFGNPGTFVQYRCDPTSFRGVCHYNKSQPKAYAQCAEGEFFLSCWLGGGVWSTEQEDIDKTCFPRAPESKPLVDQSESLEEILEYGEIYGACDRYFADPDNASRREMLLCGKWMYFYEHFNFPSVPTSIFTFLQNNFPNSVGTGWEKMGMFTDPYDRRSFPIGLVDAPNLPGTNIATVNWSCTSCHLGKTPDGKFVVGQNNNNYDYAKQLLALTIFNYIVLDEDDVEYAPEAMAVLQPLREEWQANPNYLSLLIAVLPLLNIEQPEGMSLAIQAETASWDRGILDPLSFPVEADDFVHSPLKIPSVYGIPSPETFADLGFDPDSHARLGWAGNTGDMLRFSNGFVALGPDDLDNWPEARLKPLIEYVFSLTAPKNPAQLDQNRVAAGEVLFTTVGCANCHNGPNFMGMDVYSFEEIGTDPAHKWQMDGAQDYGLPVPNLTPDDPLSLTHAISAPKLVGLWTQDKFLHNGSVGSLADLFCLDHERPTITDIPFSDGGHRYTCDGLNREDKLSLMEFLLSL